jgi:hypothetical protein
MSQGATCEHCARVGIAPDDLTDASPGREGGDGEVFVTAELSVR